jgi:peptidoglycan/LPS O-acetylase OafA/YrhL
VFNNILKDCAMAQKERFYEIDLLRFLAAVFVMLFHYTFRGFAKRAMPAIGIPALTCIFKYGYLGVNLFFIISGFVVLMSAIDRSPKDFVISRIVRLYPAFWTCCTITAVIACFWGKNQFVIKFWQFLINLTMLQNFVHVRAVDGVYWSLAVEIVFYFFIFLLLIFRQIKNIEYFLAFWLIASLVREECNSFKIVLLFGTYIVAIANAVKSASYYEKVYGTEFNAGVVISVIGIFYVIFFLIVFDKSIILRLDRFLFFGALTYPLYLIHQYVGYIIFNALYLYVNRVVLLILTIGIIFLIAYLVHVCIEKGFSPKLKRLLETL